MRTASGSQDGAPSSSEAIRKSDERMLYALEGGRMVAWDWSRSPPDFTLSGNVTEVLGLAEALLYEEAGFDHLHRLTAALEARPTQDGELRWVRPNDSKAIWLDGRGRVSRDARGEVCGLQGLVTDVTARKIASDLRARAAALQADYERAQERERLRASFLAHLSHELRTPLNAIIGFTELLQDGHVEPGSPEYRDVLDTIAGSGRRLLELVDELLCQTEETTRSGSSGAPPTGKKG